MASGPKANSSAGVLGLVVGVESVSYSLFSPGIEPNQYYEAPQERVAPRSLRLGVAVYF